jgi:hypothetical protein
MLIFDTLVTVLVSKERQEQYDSTTIEESQADEALHIFPSSPSCLETDRTIQQRETQKTEAAR